MSVHSAPRAVLTAGIGVVRCALVVRLLDEWWSYLPAGTIDDQVGDLGLSYGQSGWLLALLTLGGLVGSPVAALADRGHRRVLAVGGTLTIAVALMAFAAAAPFPVLVVAALALGGAKRRDAAPPRVVSRRTGRWSARSPPRPPAPDHLARRLRVARTAGPRRGHRARLARRVRADRRSVRRVRFRARRGALPVAAER
ncbi:MAG: MFS transporter [Actinomycetota bacterium]|nr:MAG: MFS transporter [Actinomycetota bacterium]